MNNSRSYRARKTKPVFLLVFVIAIVGTGFFVTLAWLERSSQPSTTAKIDVSANSKDSSAIDAAALDDAHDSPLASMKDHQEAIAPTENTRDTEILAQGPTLQEPDREDIELEGLVQSFLSDIKKAANRRNGYDVSELPPNVAENLLKSPEFASRLLNHYASMANGSEKSTLHNLFIDVAAMSGSPAIANLIAERIDNNDEATGALWLGLLAEIGARTEASRDSVFAVLPNLSEPANLGAAITAIAPEITTPETRRSVINELRPYLDHPDPAVRSAAIHTISNWGSNQQAPLLERALTDASPDVRHAAAAAALTSNVQSNSIKSGLIAIMTSGEENMSTRVQAHYALTRYSLQDNEYAEFHDFHQMLSNLNQAKPVATPKG